MLWKALFIGVISALLCFALEKYMFLDYPRHYYKHHPGKCEVIKNAGLGSENFHVTSEGLAFITSGCSFSTVSGSFLAYMKKNNIYKGRILMYNFNKPKLGAVSLVIKPSTTFDPETFRPHGISVLEDSTKGQHLVYVVSHPYPAGDTVEKFKYNPKTQELVHMTSITGDMMRITNDLAVVAEDQFYISNYLYSTSKGMATIETIFDLPWGGLLFYNETGFSKVSPGLPSPNGVVVSNDNRYVYVAMATQKKIYVYRRGEDNSLILVQSIPAYSCVDNLHLSQDGGILYATGHPLAYKILHHMEDPQEEKAPSHVLSFPLSDGLISPEGATELFYDHGDLISASTQGAVYKNTLLVGSLVDTLVVCSITETM